MLFKLYKFACLLRLLLIVGYYALRSRGGILYYIVVGSLRLVPRMHCSRRLIVQTLVFSHSYLHRQVSPPDTLVMKVANTWARNGRWILPKNARLPSKIQSSFTCSKSTTWDRQLYFPSEGRCAEDFFAVKNPTASVGFVPANLGTKGQHATSRPPKTLISRLNTTETALQLEALISKWGGALLNYYIVRFGRWFDIAIFAI